MTASTSPQQPPFATTEPPEREPPVSTRHLLVALFVPATAWAVHEMACAAFAGWACLHGHVTLVRVTTLVLTAVGLVLSVGSSLVSLRSYRALSSPSASPFETDADAWREMLAVAGILLGLVFTLGLVWGGLPAVLFGASFCEVTR